MAEQFLKMQITCEHNTEHLGLVELATSVVATLAPAASAMSEAASLTACNVTIRITDQFTAEVEAYDSLRYLGYTTERVGGLVAAITLFQDVTKVKPLVLINSAAFTGDEPMTLAYFPMTLGHEIAHCMIGQARVQHCTPQGYCSRPMNLIETVGYTALSVCDEFLADALTKGLLPSVEVGVTTDKGETRIAARTVVALGCLMRMCNDLDMHVFPAWRDAVQQYRIRRRSLDDMTTGLITAIQSGLILSAHYRAATMDLSDDLDKVRQINQHLAMQLYFTPFWNRVGPILDTRIENAPVHRFAEDDQEVFDTATDAVRDVWQSLGITFEKLPAGQVYVHVNEPLGF